MIDYVKWSKTVALVESEDNPHAWGDEGLACGRYQQHPAFTLEWLAMGRVQVGVDWSWDRVFAAALRIFFNVRSLPTPDPLRLVMEFHLGVQAVKDGKWDVGYAERWGRYWDKMLLGEL